MQFYFCFWWEKTLKEKLAGFEKYRWFKVLLY